MLIRVGNKLCSLCLCHNHSGKVDFPFFGYMKYSNTNRLVLMCICNYSGCRVDCFFFRWDHAFVLKDYTAKDLEISYVMLSVIGKKAKENKVIGKTILAGKNGK